MSGSTWPPGSMRCGQRSLRRIVRPRAPELLVARHDLEGGSWRTASFLSAIHALTATRMARIGRGGQPAAGSHDPGLWGRQRAGHDCPDPADHSVLDVAPVHRGQRLGGRGVQVVPGEHVRPINRHQRDVNMDRSRSKSPAAPGVEARGAGAHPGRGGGPGSGTGAGGRPCRPDAGPPSAVEAAVAPRAALAGCRLDPGPRHWLHQLHRRLAPCKDLEGDPPLGEVLRLCAPREMRTANHQIRSLVISDGLGPVRKGP
jgi:hypothetical protein